MGLVVRAAERRTIVASVVLQKPYPMGVDPTGPVGFRVIS